MLTPEQLRSLKKTLAHIEAARSELKALHLAGTPLDLEAQNNLVTAHVKLQMLLRVNAEQSYAPAYEPGHASSAEAEGLRFSASALSSQPRFARPA